MDPLKIGMRNHGRSVKSGVRIHPERSGKPKRRKTKDRENKETKARDILVKINPPVDNKNKPESPQEENNNVERTSPLETNDKDQSTQMENDNNEQSTQMENDNKEQSTQMETDDKEQIAPVENETKVQVDASTDTTNDINDANDSGVEIVGTVDVCASTQTDVGVNTDDLAETIEPSDAITEDDGDDDELLSHTQNGDETSRNNAALAEVKAGLHRAYLDSIEFMRLKVTETEEELDQIKMGFYQSDATDDGQYEKYLIKCNEQFLRANNELRRKNVKLKVIDGEVQIVSMINSLREHCEVDKGEIAFISEFWENMKTSMESLKVLIHKFKSSVMDRLRGNCISYNNAEIQLEVSIRYTEEISQYLADIERGLTDTQILLKSFANGVHQDLFQHTKFTENILVACDLKAFPILRLFPDLTEKIESMCATAIKWLDRDERYMFEINDYIKETRTRTKRRAEDLKVQKNKMKKFEKSVKAANILLNNNKEKLQKLETDLNQLESTLDVYKQQLELKNGEKSQKESMVDFLKLTLSQTKKNYNLQLKRQRLLKQVQDLEEFLRSLERDLSSVQYKIQEKAQQKDMLAGKVEDSEKAAGVLKTDLEQFTSNLDKLEHEVNNLSGQLLQLEIIQTFKSSPENMDKVYDRPQSVKLAPSLKEKIKQRKRKIVAPVN